MSISLPVIDKSQNSIETVQNNSLQSWGFAFVSLKRFFFFLASNCHHLVDFITCNRHKLLQLYQLGPISNLLSKPSCTVQTLTFSSSSSSPFNPQKDCSAHNHSGKLRNRRGGEWVDCKGENILFSNAPTANGLLIGQCMRSNAIETAVSKRSL